MIRNYLPSIALSFWASPHESMSAIVDWASVRSERNSFVTIAVDPGILRASTADTPSPHPLPDFPTDVPVPEPHDVPVPEPHDVPVPEPIDPPPRDPGKAPPPDKPEPKPKPRSVP
jgi:hypothetical protein